MAKIAAPPKPPLTIEWMALDELEQRIDPENPKDHDVGALLESFEEFGYIDPVILNEKTGTVISGHGRIKTTRAAFNDGRDPPYNVHDDGRMWHLMVIRGVTLTKVKGKAYLLAGNMGDLAGWDEPKKLALLEQLAKARRLKGTGYDGDDVDRMRRFYERLQKRKERGGTTKKDEIAVLRKKWGTKPAQLWEIPTESQAGGSHRLLIGDSTLAKSWTQLMAGQHAALVFTDPPYGVEYQDPQKRYDHMASDLLKRDDFAKFLTKAFKQCVKWSIDKAAFYIWHASMTRDDFSFAMKAAGLREIQLMVWVKNTQATWWSDYAWQHEPVFYAVKDGERPNWYGDFTETTVWHFESIGANGTEAVEIDTGIVVSDGQGNEVYVTTKIPNRKIRHIRLDEGESIDLTSQLDANTDVWRGSSRIHTSEALHPTPKPVVLAEKAIVNSSKFGELVIDAFLGSGTTMVAAENMGRLCNGMELEPGYSAVILERMSALGLKPALTP